MRASVVVPLRVRACWARRAVVCDRAEWGRGNVEGAGQAADAVREMRYNCRRRFIPTDANSPPLYVRTTWPGTPIGRRRSAPFIAKGPLLVMSVRACVRSLHKPPPPRAP